MVTLRNLIITAGLSGVLLIAGCETAENGLSDAATRGAEALRTATTQDVTRYDAETFFNTTSFSIAGSGAGAFAPDGNALLVSSDETGVFNAYTLDLEDGTRTALTQSQSDATFAISYFPDGERILTSADNGGDELNHIYVTEKDGTVRDLTPGEKVKAAFVSWINDREAFVIQTNARDPRFFDLYTVDSDTYESERIFENDLGLGSLAISGDGRYIAGAKERTSADSDIYLVDLQALNPAPQLITEHEGNIAHGVYDFTPEGDGLIYATDAYGEFVQAWRYDLATEEKSPLIEADWDVSYVTYSPSGKYRVSGINEDASTRVSITDRETSSVLTLPAGLPDGDLRQVRFSPEEDRIAFAINASNAPSNIFTVDLQSGDFRQYTQALNTEIDPDDLVTATVKRYESFDGLEIPGILYRPKQASANSPVPAMVWVHGGPGGQSRTGYNPAIQHMVNHGYAVFAANNRGSSGYGKTFYHLDDRNHGDGDLQDIVAAKGYLADLDWVDGERIGVIGGSYGGYMVAAALAFEPEVFDVGINIFGVTNWLRTLKSIPPWWESFRESLYDELGDPATDEERLRRISPLFHAENIIKPLLVVQGANDPRVLQVESDELVAAVRANGVPVEYIVFPDEGHGFRKRSNRITASEAYVRFLDTHLKGTRAE